MIRDNLNRAVESIDPPGKWVKRYLLGYSMDYQGDYVDKWRFSIFENEKWGFCWDVKFKEGWLRD